MTLDQLLDNSPERLEAMTEAEYEAFFAPMFAVTRPDPNASLDAPEPHKIGKGKITGKNPVPTGGRPTLSRPVKTTATEDKLARIRQIAEQMNLGGDFDAMKDGMK